MELRERFDRGGADAARRWAEDHLPEAYAELLLTLWAAEWGTRDFSAAQAWAREQNAAWALLAAAATAPDDLAAAESLATWADTENGDSNYRGDLVVNVLESTGRPDRALAVLAGLAAEPRLHHERRLLSAWADQNPAAALDHLLHRAADPESTQNLLDVVREWPDTGLPVLGANLAGRPSPAPEFRAAAEARIARARREADQAAHARQPAP